MNHPHRRRTPAGPVARGALVLAALAGLADPAHAATRQTDASTVTTAAATTAADVETLLRTTPTAESFARHLRYLTEEPHPAGSPRNMELADYVRDRFIEYGLEEVHFHDTPALLSRPVSASVELEGPLRVKLKLAEEPYAADKDSYLYREPGVVPYHAYARSGEVTAEAVYANNGGPEDFAVLAKLNVDLRGRIVVMRYSNPYSYRGYKVFMAESRGAAGVIIYSDPQDDGYARGDVYPDGPWGPPSHLQLGSIVYDWLGPGEPFTFHWKKGRGGSWKEGRPRDRQLANIPSIPLSYEDAARILSGLGGPAAPGGWQGGLPFTYHLGPGPAQVHLRVENRERVGTMRNIVGLIRGRAEPDRWVVLGNHRDAWAYGGVDPSGGTSVLLETARALGTAARAGHRPRRTIVFANWDAEEDLLGGSTSWVKDERSRLLRGGVVYINVDEGASGPDFRGGSSPALAWFLKDAARAVHDPDRGGSVYDAWSGRARDGVAEVEDIVGATDYTAFQEHIGMSCIDMEFTGPYGVYHSQYDDYFWVERFGDPGFRYNTTLARLWGIMAWRLADAEVLPMRYSDYARAIPGYIDRIESMAANAPASGNGAAGAPPGTAATRPLRLDAARAAAGRWLKAAEEFEAALDRQRSASPALSDAPVRRINDLLLQVERAMTERRGLETRPFFKHLIYAPQPTYREEILPRIFEAIEAGRPETIASHERELVAAFDRASDLARRARGVVESGTAKP